MISPSPGTSDRLLLAVKGPTGAAFLIALLFLTISLITIRDYGMSWDEPAVMERGQETFELIRGRGRMLDAADETELGGINSHPAFYAACDYAFSNILTYLFGWRPLVTAHLLNVLTATAGLVILYFLGRDLFNPTVGLAAELLLALFPRFVSHAQYNSKDIPVMVFGTLSLLLLNRAAAGGKKRYWLLAGISVAASITTKLDGLFLLPIFFLPWLVSLRWSEKPVRWGREFFRVWVFFAAAIPAMFLFWPLLLLSPTHLFHSVSYFSRPWMNQSTRYLGREYAQNIVPWHYLPMHLIVVTPVISLLMMIAGAILSLRALWRRECLFQHALLWYWLLIPLAARMLPGTIAYDGMRHVFLVVPALAIFAGIAVDHFVRWCRQRQTSLLAPALMACGAAAWLGWQIVESFPQQGSYLNEATRWIVPASKRGSCFDIWGWGTIYKSGVDWLNSHAPQKRSFAVVHHAPQFDKYEIRPDLELLDMEDANRADFVMVEGCHAELMTITNAVLVHSIQSFGSDLLLIYQCPHSGQ